MRMKNEPHKENLNKIHFRDEWKVWPTFRFLFFICQKCLRLSFMSNRTRAECDSTMRAKLLSLWQTTFSKSSRENGHKCSVLLKEVQKSQTIRRSPTHSIGTLKSLEGKGRSLKTGSSALGCTNRSSTGYLIGSSLWWSSSTNQGSYRVSLQLEINSLTTYYNL